MHSVCARRTHPIRRRSLGPWASLTTLASPANGVDALLAGLGLTSADDGLMGHQGFVGPIFQVGLIHPYLTWLLIDTFQ